MSTKLINVQTVGNKKKRGKTQNAKVHNEKGDIIVRDRIMIM